ncbi:MAG: hypothetical protein U1F43_39245, partial [Myxococcota bacterium]
MGRRTIASLIAAVVAGVLAAAAPARATLVRPFSLSELCRAAHSIVRGEVVDEEVIWDAERHEVYTLSWVRVDEALAGADAPGDLVAVRQIGGVIDGVERRVVGTATLALGDEVVLFARSDGAFHYLVGMAQGAFHLERSARAPAGAAVASRGAVATLAEPGAPTRPLAPDRIGWDELRAEVVRILA